MNVEEHVDLEENTERGADRKHQFMSSKLIDGKHARVNIAHEARRQRAEIVRERDGPCQ